MRRGRTHIIKLALSVLIILAIIYLLFSNSNAHERAREVISARFTGPRTKPVFIKGNKKITSNRLIWLNFKFHFRS